MLGSYGGRGLGGVCRKQDIPIRGGHSAPHCMVEHVLYIIYILLAISEAAKKNPTKTTNN